MLKKVLLFLLILSLFSCRQEESQPIKPVIEDPDWIRLEIPAGQEAYAIAGDIEKTLLVATFTKAYYSTDQGKTWQLSKDFRGNVPGLRVHNDTVFSLHASGQDQTGQPYASTAQYFTADYGRSWQPCSKVYTTPEGYMFYSLLSQPKGLVTSTNGITYRIIRNQTPDYPGATSFYLNPSGLEKELNFVTQTLHLPFEHLLLNLHVDVNNRLYVAASGGSVTKENRIYCCEDNTPAIVYVSRKPLP